MDEPQDECEHMTRLKGYLFQHGLDVRAPGPVSVTCAGCCVTREVDLRNPEKKKEW